MYNGLKMAKHTTIATMKEYVEIIKGLLSGHDFSYKGNFFDFHKFPKLVDKELDIPILFGSSGDKMLKLAGEIADGVILNSIGTEEYFKHAILVINDSIRESNRDIRQDLEIGSSTTFSVADKREDAINAARHEFLFYILYLELDPVIEKTPYAQRVDTIRC